MSANDNISRSAPRINGESISCDVDVAEEKGVEFVAKARVPINAVMVSASGAKLNNGNWHTAHRWAKFLSGHCDIEVVEHWLDGPQIPSREPQIMVALHARRSAPSITAWAKAYPDKPLIVVLTGTDLYRDIAFDSSAQQSLNLATHLVVLQGAGLAMVPEALRSKTHVIYQSAPLLKPAVKSKQYFRALMVGHLREEKDPLTFMTAAIQTSVQTSTADTTDIYFDQIGQALDPFFADEALATAQQTTRYRWLGGLPRAATRQHIKRAHVLVNCSKMEGGAQVILEAVQSGTPVLASRVDGNVGMLGTDYLGYFEWGNHAELAALIKRCATDLGFLEQLKNQCLQRSPLFMPIQEKRLVINLVLSALSSPSAFNALNVPKALNTPPL